MPETPSLNMASQPPEQLPINVGVVTKPADFDVDLNLAERVAFDETVLVTNAQVVKFATTGQG